MSDFVWVAMDPTQPGAASAIMVDDGTDLARMHATLAKWAKSGRIPERVTHEEGIIRINKWVRPCKQGKLL